MKKLQEFAKYYTISMFVGFMMFFVFDYLKKQEIFAVLFVSLLFSIAYLLLNKKKTNK